MEKKIFIALLLLMFTLGANAQTITKSEDGKYSVYCVVVGYNFWGVGKLKVRLDMGYSTKNENSLYGEDGKKIKFNSMMEVLDYMGKRGWRLVNTYYISDSPNQHVVNYVMEKRVYKDSEKTEGLIVKAENVKENQVER